MRRVLFSSGSGVRVVVSPFFLESGGVVSRAHEQPAPGAATAAAVTKMPDLLISALTRQADVCFATCACSRRPRNASSSLQRSESSGHTADAEQRNISQPKVTMCSTHTRVKSYLASVYPTAADHIAQLDSREATRFFNSLHFYYDHECQVRASASGSSDVGHGGMGSPIDVGVGSRVVAGPGSSSCDDGPSVLLRWIYGELLPCAEQLNAHGRPTLGPCIAAHFRFRPAWARRAAAEGWVEVEHRAIGFGVHRASSGAAARAATPAHQDGQPMDASAFLDAGVASMWYTYRRGSGIFYRMGKTKFAPGKTAMVAALLRELATQRNTTATVWPSIAQRARLFAGDAPSQGALKDSERLLYIAKGESACTERGVLLCRCRYIVQDEWDDAIIWMARELGYETLFFTATLLCNQPLANGTLPTRRSFGTAYPELVDVRPLTPKMVEEQAWGVHSYLGVEGEGKMVNVRSLRKRADVADAWVRQIRDDGRLALRDPFNRSEGRERASRPCRFRTDQRTLQCDAHVSSQWPESSWHRCGVPMCGFRGARIA